MKLIKLDENLCPPVADVFRTAGFDVHTVWDEHLEGSSDQDLFAHCVAEGRILITQDLDFADLRTFSSRPHHGIVVLRLERQDSREQIRVAEWLVRHLGAELDGQLWIADGVRIRVKGGRE